MQLFQRILDEYPDSLDARFAHELLGDGFHRAGRLDDAEREYRTVLETNPSLSATTGEAHLSLAEVLLDRQDPRLADEVAALLDAAQPHLTFNTTIFRRYLLSARLAAMVGDDDARREAARRALELVNAPPQLARHPTVGLPRPSSQTLHELERLTRP
jgi:tetratricopeptide (TPR) repeat protein